MAFRIPNTFSEEEIRNAIRRLRSELENIVTVETDPVFSAWATANDHHVNWDAAYSHKTTEDALNGIVVVNGAGVYSAVTNNSTNWNTAYDLVNFPIIGTPTYSTVENWFNQFGSAGILNDTTYVTDLDANTIRVAAGQGLLRKTDSTDGELTFIEWPQVDLTMPTTQGSVRYIGIEYNAGTPQAVSRTSFDWNWNNDFPIAKIYHDGTSRHVVNANAHSEDIANKARRYLREVFPFARTATSEAGGLLIDDLPSNKFAMTAGKLWHGFNEYDISAVDTSAAGVFRSYVRATLSTWNAPTFNVQTWDNTHYDDGSGTLVEMTVGRYANLWWYVDAEDGDVTMLYGRDQYTSSSLAQAEAVPNTTPGNLTEHARLLGRFIFKKSETTATLVQNTADVIFQFSGEVVSDHGALTGLSDDDHAQYHNDSRAATWLAANHETTYNHTNYNAAYSHKTTEDAINGIVKCDGAGNYSAVTDSSTNWNSAYSHKTTEDAINGLVKCNGAGSYSAVTDNSAAWDAAGLTEDAALECLLTDGVAGGAESDPVFVAWQTANDHHANWDTAYGWGNWAHTTLAGYGITDAAPLALKTTLDALNGYVKCDGAGNYSAQISNPFAEASVVTDTTADGVIKAIATIPVPSGKILSVEAWVIGNNSADHSIGIGTLLMCAAHNAAGTATMVGSSTNIVQNRSSSPYSASFTVSGTNVVLNVTGNAGVTMNWKAYYKSWSY